MKDENSETLEKVIKSLEEMVKELKKDINQLPEQLESKLAMDSFKSLDKKVQLKLVKKIGKAKKPKCCTGKSFVVGFLLGLGLVIFLSVIVMCCCCKADCIRFILC